MKMAEVVYFACAFASLACAILLYRGYKRTPTHLLLWSGLCFCFLAANNMILFVDLVVFPEFDINGQLWRNVLSAGAGSVLLFGLVWEFT